MARQIDQSKPLSDEDRDWLLTRGQNGLVERLDREFAGQPAEAPEDEPEEVEDQPNGDDPDADGEPEEASYDHLVVKELEQLLKDRGLPTSGTKQELIDRLTESDAG